MFESIKKSLFGNEHEEVQVSHVNETDDAVATKLGLKLADATYKAVNIDTETGVVSITDELIDTPPAFSSDPFLVNMMADFANSHNVTLPKWTAEPLKIAKAIADWQE